MDFKGKCIVVTGAASGIGLHLVQALIKRGDCLVCAVDRDIHGLKRLRTRYGRCIFTHFCNVSKPNELDALLSVLYTPKGHWPGYVDIFISNAGFGYYEKLEKPDWRHIEAIFQTNFYAPVYTLLKMQTYAGERPFQFVISASAIGIAPLPGYALYSATKAALDAFAKAYRFERNPSAQLTMIYPLAIVTPFYRRMHCHARIPLARQSMHSAIKHILKGIRQDKHFIYPSLPFRIVRYLHSFIPFMPLLYKLEAIRFQNWVRKYHHIVK